MAGKRVFQLFELNSYPLGGSNNRESTVLIRHKTPKQCFDRNLDSLRHCGVYFFVLRYFESGKNTLFWFNFTKFNRLTNRISFVHIFCRFNDAGYYFWQLSMQCLDLASQKMKGIHSKSLISSLKFDWFNQSRFQRCFEISRRYDFQSFFSLRWCKRCRREYFGQILRVSKESWHLLRIPSYC